MSLYWKMRTNFPFSKVFVLGIILSLLGLVCMIISIVAFVTQSWGHYAGTGMWGGAIILATGLTAVFVSQLRSLASVKTFCIFSFIAVFTSLVMLILSAGGLSLNSEFYSYSSPAEYNKRTSILIHASLLVNAVFCLFGSILAVTVCCKYLVFEYHDKTKCNNHNRSSIFGTIRSPSSARNGNLNSNNIRSVNIRTPLNPSGASRRHSDNVGNRVQIEFWRCYKHSSSDQSQSNSGFRRLRHSHTDQRSNNTNLLSPCGVHDKRNGNKSSQVRGDKKDKEELNIIPLSQMSTRPLLQVQNQTRVSRNHVTTTPMIHLPTEFNEEELPPYEAVQAAENAISGSHSDSGDESDTENSSSTDIQSYNANAHVREGIDTVPLVETQKSLIPQMQNITEQLKTTNCTSFCKRHSNIMSSANVAIGENNLAKQTISVNSLSDCPGNTASGASCTGGTTSVIMRKDSRRPNRLVLSYIHTPSRSQKDPKFQLSLSPKICAATGDNTESAQINYAHVPHLVKENFYENGPSYENLRNDKKNVEKASMNHLSKPSSSSTKSVTVGASTKDKETQAKASSSQKRAQANGSSSPVSNTSPQLQQNSFGSSLSAFRPVCAPSASNDNNSFSLFLTDDCHLQNNVTNDNNDNQNTSKHIYINASSPNRNLDSISKPTSKYIDQGAKPKTTKHNSDINISWKNIQPGSYNHFESASNELEKKLPSKLIPFTDSKADFPCTSSKKEVPTQTKLSSKINFHPQNTTSSTAPPISTAPSSSTSTSALTPKSLALPVSLFGAGVEANSASTAKLSNNINCETADNLSKKAAASSAVMTSNIPVCLVREASTQVNSLSSSRWHSRRMGGNQTLLQNRQEELHNSQLSHRSLEASARPIRPSSMPLAGGFSVICHGISGLAADRQSRHRFNEASSTNSTVADSINPQPINSFLTNHTGQQQPQALTVRQNHLLQHYPLQPQQPRLGVQLHQRRQQQHQLQQNIESQQQHQLQQQQPQAGNHQNIQGRIGRPLFSVLL